MTVTRALLATASWAGLVAAAGCGSPAATPAPKPATPVIAPAAVVPAPPAPPPPPPPRIVSDDPIIQTLFELSSTDSQVDAHLRYLTAQIGPRLTSSHNLMRAEQWARDQLAGWGLDARLERWGEFPVGFDRGAASGQMVSPARVDLDFTTPAWTPGVFGPVEANAAYFPMTVVEARAFASTAKGAWVVHRKSERTLTEKTRKKLDAIVESAGIAGHVYRASGKRNLVVTSGRYRISWDKLPTQVRIRLRGDQYDDIAKRMDSGADVVLRFSIDNRFFRGPVPQYDVIADIPGTENSDEYVVIGGHIDSWDGAVGAVDNGTGVATTMEAARLLMAAGAKPRRTIRFMLWSGEEQGLLGSRSYVDNHKNLMDKISVVLVHDGGTNFLSGLRVTPEMADDANKVFAPVIGLDKTMPFALFYADSLRLEGSDHNSFIRAGVPGFFWRQSGVADYQRAHHTQYDTLDAAVPGYQRHSALVVAMAAWGFAQLDHKLDRSNSAPIDRRLIGVLLDGTTITRVLKGGKAKAAKLKPGDTIVAIDGKPMKGRRDIARAIGSGEPKKLVTIDRKGKKRDVVLDYAGDKQEKQRAERDRTRLETFGTLDYTVPFAGSAWKKPGTEKTEPAKTP